MVAHPDHQGRWPVFFATALAVCWFFPGQLCLLCAACPSKCLAVRSCFARVLGLPGCAAVCVRSLPGHAPAAQSGYATGGIFGRDTACLHSPQSLSSALLQAGWLPAEHSCQAKQAGRTADCNAFIRDSCTPAPFHCSSPHHPSTAPPTKTAPESLASPDLLGWKRCFGVGDCCGWGDEDVGLRRALKSTETSPRLVGGDRPMLAACLVGPSTRGAA